MHAGLDESHTDMQSVFEQPQDHGADLDTVALESCTYMCLMTDSARVSVLADALIMNILVL